LSSQWQWCCLSLHQLSTSCWIVWVGSANVDASSRLMGQAPISKSYLLYTDTISPSQALRSHRLSSLLSSVLVTGSVTPLSCKHDRTLCSCAQSARASPLFSSQVARLLRFEHNAGNNAAPAARCVRSQQGFKQEGGFLRPCCPWRRSHIHQVCVSTLLRGSEPSPGAVAYHSRQAALAAVAAETSPVGLSQQNKHAREQLRTILSSLGADKAASQLDGGCWQLQ
jgi:hypothetical protein